MVIKLDPYLLRKIITLNVVNFLLENIFLKD